MLQPASAEAKGSPRFSWRSKIWDALAVAAIAFAVWKIFIAPRSFDSPGYVAPHAVFERLDGGKFRVADQQGHVVFLDFYASWCEPCKLELPLVEAWRRAHRNATVIPVDVGESASVARAFARRYSLENVAVDPSGSAQPLFSVEGFPTLVVIDPGGHVRAKWVGLNPAIGLAMSNAQQHLSAR